MNTNTLFAIVALCVALGITVTSYVEHLDNAVAANNGLQQCQQPRGYIIWQKDCNKN